LIKDPSGKIIETIPQLFKRVATAVAAADSIYGSSRKDIDKLTSEFYDLMYSRDFLPNTPALMNMGKKMQMGSACFVLPVFDSMESIFSTQYDMSMVHRYGGGTGFNFGNLRPKGSFIHKTGGKTSGPISFIDMYNHTTEAVKQGGTRRGANMGVLPVWHPDILDFITCKATLDDKHQKVINDVKRIFNLKDDDLYIKILSKLLIEQQVTNFNISVAVNDSFMQALKNSEDWALVFNNKEYDKIKATDIFDTIIKHIWLNGEPGLLFLDTINSNNPTYKKDATKEEYLSGVGVIDSTNPCGEIPIFPYESCNLASINLGHFVSKEKEIEYDRLSDTVVTSVHFLDNILDINQYPTKDIERVTKLNRKMGLGVMGWADMLTKLEITYGSEHSFRMAEQVMDFIETTAKNASEELGRERGNFPNFDKSIYKQPSSPYKYMRNATVTAIAPTGSLSKIADCSSGIEPHFGTILEYHVLDTVLKEENPLFIDKLKEKNINIENIREDIIKNRGSIQNIEWIQSDWKEIQKLFVTTFDLNYEQHVRMQAAFQKYTDNAVSKTINLKNTATEKDIKEAILLAYKLGCKGLTLYRDQSREKQVLDLDRDKKALTKIQIKHGEIRPRPSTTVGKTQKFGLKECGSLYVTMNNDDVGFCEVFAKLGPHGNCINALLSTISTLTSLLLRAGVDPSFIIRRLKGIRCPFPSLIPGGVITSCPDAIGKAMEAYIKNQHIENNHKTIEINDKGAMVGTCPDCGVPLRYQDSCLSCPQCGWSPRNCG